MALAARWINEGRRLDMQGLADEFRVSRVTLFRRVGSREELISQALWLLTERTLETAAARWEAERPEGELHTLGTGRHINAIVSQATGLRRLLDDEPALALRVLTDPRGRVQSGIVAFVEDLLRRDMTEFGLVTIIEPDALAYALVRLGESFLYADVLAARKPDVATADRLQQALVEGILPLRHEPGREWPAAVRTIKLLLADKVGTFRPNGPWREPSARCRLEEGEDLRRHLGQRGQLRRVRSHLRQLRRRRTARSTA
ncbi:MAG TPA: QsdR family transcriptional regulator [Streptosporangiaceae bacterium]|nr:QsdR family transcriptional regulator [Streptosporangiaceae bacterium]